MDEQFIYNSITITTTAGKNLVQFDVRHLEGGQQEQLSLSVLIPSESSLALREIQKAATRRAIELLQTTLLD